MLVVTPSLEASESLVGYVIRVAQENGYPDPKSVLNHAGYKSTSSFGARCDLSLLASIVNKDVEELFSCAYAESDRHGDSLGYLGHRLTSNRMGRILRPKETSICPMCVEEDGYVSGFWDLTLATACPKHQQKVLRVCTECNEAINWIRPGVSTCQCGADLTQAKGKRSNCAELELMAMLRAKFESKRILRCANSSGFPLKELDGLTFVEFSSLVFLLGQHTHNLSYKDAQQQPDLVIEGAITSLSDWPNGLFGTLSRVGKRGKSAVCTLDTLRNQFGPLIRGLTKDRCLSSATDFVQEQVVRYFFNNTVEKLLDNISKSPGRPRPKRTTFSVDELCERSDVAKKRLEGWCRRRELNTQRISYPAFKRFVVESEILGYLSISTSGGMSERRAAACMGLPVSALKGLCELGYLRPTSISGNRHSYSTEDVNDFIETLRKIGEGQKIKRLDHTDLVSLARILEATKFRSKLGKAQFVADVIESRIEPFGRTGLSAAQLFFRKSTVDLFIQDAKHDIAPHGLSRAEAAARIGCSGYCVKELIAQGRLSMIGGMLTNNVCSESMEAFCETFVALSTLAKPLQTLARRLAKVAQNAGMTTLQVTCERDITTTFIRRVDVDALKREFVSLTSIAEKVGGDKRKIVKTDEALKRLSKYLKVKKRSGQPLPRRRNRINKRMIAKEAGVDVALFYRSSVARGLLGSADQDDARRHGVEMRSDLEVIRCYLERVRSGKEVLPIGRRGRPSKARIAEAIGIHRNAFYRLPGALDLLSEYLSEGRHSAYRTSKPQ